jgi:hypothetical protein
MDFCLKGRESEARSSQTATRLLAVLWFEWLLLVWRLHRRTIRPASRILLVGGKGNRVCIRARPQPQGFVSFSPDARPCRGLLRRSLVTSY